MMISAAAPRTHGQAPTKDAGANEEPMVDRRAALAATGAAAATTAVGIGVASTLMKAPARTALALAGAGAVAGAISLAPAGLIIGVSDHSLPATIGVGALFGATLGVGASILLPGSNRLGAGMAIAGAATTAAVTAGWLAREE